MLAALLTGALINRSLAPFNRGIFAEIQIWIDLFIIIFGISMEVAIYHFANKTLYNYDDKTKLATIFFMTFVYSIIAVLALKYCVLYWPQKFSFALVNSLTLVTILLVTTMLVTNLTVFLQAAGNIKYSALIGILQALFNVLIIGYGYFLGIIDVRFVVERLVIIQIIALLLLFIVFFKSGLLLGRFSMNMAKGMMIAGFKQHIGTISCFIYTKVNQLIVFRYCGEREAGIFAVSLNLAFSLIFIPEVFRTVLYPRIIHSNDDYDITIKSLRLGFYGWGAVVLCVILFAKPLLLIYAGKEFLPAINIFRIIMIGTWLLAVSSLFAPYFIKAGAFMFSSFLAATLGIISIALNIWLVPIFASTGAGIATAITCFTGFCMVLLFMWRLTRKNPFVIFKINFKDFYLFKELI